MKKLLIMSVYAPGTWGLYNHQSRFLERTTKDYDHIVVSPQKPPVECEWRQSARRSHIMGLRIIRELAAQKQGEYESMCLMDSDAFPVRADWQDTLDTAIAEGGKTYAAPIRVENYDLFPHVSFVYAKSSEFAKMKMMFVRGNGMGLFTKRIQEVGAGLDLWQCLPLLKSNIWSPHFRWHIVYSDIIYHKGAGSRKVRKFKRGSAVWKRLMPSVPLTIAGDPTPKFINSLVGEERFKE